MHRHFQKELNKSLCFTKNSKQMCLKKNVIGSSGRLVEKLRMKSESIASLENLAGCTSAQSCQVSALGFTAVISENGLISRLFGLSSICIFSQVFMRVFLLLRMGSWGCSVRYIRQMGWRACGEA